jgi:hypothetical protein
VSDGGNEAKSLNSPTTLPHGKPEGAKKGKKRKKRRRKGGDGKAKPIVMENPKSE